MKKYIKLVKIYYKIFFYVRIFFFQKIFFSLVNCILNRFFFFISILWNWIKGLNWITLKFIGFNWKKVKLEDWNEFHSNLEGAFCILVFLLIMFPFTEKWKKKKRLSISLKWKSPFYFFSQSNKFIRTKILHLSQLSILKSTS